jgi:hypothetical protein
VVVCGSSITRLMCLDNSRRSAYNTETIACKVVRNPGNSGSSAVLSAFMAAWLRCQDDGAGTAPSGIACAIAGWPNSIGLRSSPLSQSDRKRIRLLGRGWPCRSGARRRTGRCCGSTRSPPPPFAVRRVIESTAEVRWYRKGRRSLATWRHTSMALLRSFLT